MVHRETMQISDIQELVLKEKDYFLKVYPSFNSSHEGFGVLLHYVDLLRKDENRFNKEIPAKISALGLIFLESVCEEEESMKISIEELLSAEKKFGGFHSHYEGFAVLLEEVDELWDVVKLNPKKIIVSTTKYIFDSQIEIRNEMLKNECKQVVAMGMRYIKYLDNWK